MQLGHLSKRKPGQLSGGQAQRITLARALVNRPRALLLDEPLGALDLRLRKQLQIELKRIQQDIGITFVHVTHDQEEAMSMANTIAVMNGGKIEQAGSATDLYERPKTAFVANFLGISNLVDAHVRSVDNGLSRVETHDGAELQRAVRALRAARDRRGPRGRAAGEDHAGAGRRGRARRRQRAARGRSSSPRSWAPRSSTSSTPRAARSSTCSRRTPRASEPDSLGVGRDVQLAWSPEHTFVVARD